MYLQLTGKEVGLVGYWRLGAISEGKVIDFSANCNDGIVYGDAYVSAATLNRKLAGGTDAVKYSNPELFAVSERATYEESFEFKVNSKTPVNVAYLDNADGKNLGTKIFTLSYWGKTSRSAEDKKPIATVQNKFEDLGNGWYRASCNFTIPDEVSMLRSFEIINIKGDWVSLEIRKHRIRLLSDSITEAKCTDSVTLATLVDNHATLVAKLKALELKEVQECVLLKEKRELEAKIAAYNAQAETRAKIEQLKAEIATMTNEDQTLLSQYTNQQNSPFNYYCYLSVKAGGDGQRVQVIGRDHLGLELVGQGVNDYQKFKFISTGDGYYVMPVKAGGDGQRVQVIGRNYLGLELVGQGINDYQKFKFISTGDGCYVMSVKAGGDGQRVQVIGRKYLGLELVGHGVNDYQKFKFISTGEQTNDNIPLAYKNWQAKVQQQNQAKEQLKLLNAALISTPADKAAWDARLAQLIKEITTIQTELNTLNTDFLNAVKNTQAKPQTMPQVGKDGKGLVTQGALLGFVQPASRLNAIESCEGNVQLSYFDIQGRMRQTNYDGTADSKNAAFEQWIPDAQRACLNFSNSNSAVKLNQPLFLPADWTIEAWFFYPLPEAGEWNTLSKGQNGGCHIVVKNRKKLGIYLNNDSLGQYFYDSGCNIELLKEGWHHLTAVGRGYTTLFYIDGIKVGDIKVKALKDAEENLKKTPNDAVAKKKVEDIKKATLKTTSDVYAIGNNHLSIDKSADYQVMKFDGVNDYVSLPEMNHDFSQGITVEAWVWYDSFNSYSRIIDFGNGAGSDNILLCNDGSSNTVVFSIHRQSTQQIITVTGALETGKWMHLAVTIDGSGTAKLYKNGEQIQTGKVALPNTIKRNNNYIGKSNWSNDSYLNGQITDVRIWKVARIQAEIKANMSQRLTGKEPNLVAYYRLNQIKFEGATRRVLDLAGNNHGTVIEANIVTDQSLSIGSFIRGEQFGKLAEVRIWGVALSDDEIAVNSKILLSGNEPNLLAYYPMSEATGELVRDQSGNGNNGKVSGVNWWGCTAPIGNIDNAIGGDALVSSEYSSVTLENNRKVAIMRRFFAYPATNGATLLPDKRVEALELKWIGNAQFAPTLLGYIEGSPPVPSENLTIQYAAEDDYNGATSVELTMSEDVAFSWTRSQDTGLGGTIDTFIGAGGTMSILTAPMVWEPQ